ncbi:MAG: YegP family protein [Silicimonas sp.]
MAGKFEIYKDKAGEFRFRLKAGNGQVILASEGYKAKASCTNGIESVRKNSQNDLRFERKQTKSGKPMFNLKASNGQVIGTSETYESDKACENGIASVAKNAPDAKVDDQTV